MALDAQRRDALIAAVAETVPGMTLRAVVRKQGVVDDFDELRKTVPEDPALAAREIAREVVRRHEAAGRAQSSRRKYLSQLKCPVPPIGPSIRRKPDFRYSACAASMPLRVSR